MTQTAEPQAPLAVVTGASSGIGLELAREFAEHGFGLIMAAEDDSLGRAADELRGLAPEVSPVQTDLSTYDGVERLYRAIAADGRPVAVAALNAGVGYGGSFVDDQELEGILKLVELNVVGTVHLAKLILNDMVDHHAGKVLFTSSIAAEAPGPYEAVYAASKSFVQSFAEALAQELEDTGVTVTAVMPGPTDTEFFGRAGMEDTKIAQSRLKSDPIDVARQAYEAVMAGKTKVLAGNLATRVQGTGMKAVPDAVKAQMHQTQSRPGSGS